MKKELITPRRKVKIVIRYRGEMTFDRKGNMVAIETRKIKKLIPFFKKD